MAPALCGLAMLLAAAAPAAAQTASVRGFVTDAATEQPLQGATVLLTDGTTRAGTATDGDGHFLLRRLPAGRYVLTVSFVGYAAHTDTLVLAAGAAVERRITLAEGAAALDEVVVRAEGETGLTAVAAGLQTIAPAQIERVPVPGVTGDLAGYLQTLPGVVAQGDRGGLFFVRGGAVDQNLALLDGLPVYLPFHILSFYSAFPEEIIDGADLYTGGFGARYGGRVSSVIDVRARNGNKQQVAGEVALAPFLSTARLEGPLVPGRVSAIASVRQSFVEQLFPDLLGQRLPYRFGDRFGKLHAFLSPNHSLSVTALHTSDRGDLAGTRKRFDGEDDATDLPPPDTTLVSWENLVVGGRYTYRSDRWPLLVEAAGGRSAMTNEVGPEDAPDRASEIESYDAALDATFFLRPAEVRLGGRARASTFTYALGGLFQDVEEAEQTLTEIDVYAETVLALAGERLRVQPGLHLYALPARGQQWIEPRLRATYRPAERHALHAAAGLYHQAVAGLNDERDVGNIFTAWLPTPEDAPVPAAAHALAGWRWQARPWLALAAEGFYKTFENLSVPLFSAFPRFTTALQPADGAARGADLRAELHGRPFFYESTLDGYVSYGLAEVEYDAAQATYHPAHDRRHQVSALLHAARGTLGFTVQYQFGSGLPFTSSGGFDVWHLMTPDVDVARDPGVLRVAYNEPFGRRQPAYHRLDVWMERRIEREHTVATLRAGAVNVLNRANLFYYDLFTFQRVDQLPLVPSLGFKVELR